MITIVRWPRPASWLRAPSPLGSAYQEWQAEILNEVADERRENFAGELLRWCLLAAEVETYIDTCWLLVLDPEDSPTISAIGRFDVDIGPDLDSVETGLRRSAAYLPKGVLRREVASQVSRGRRVVSARDLIGESSEEEGTSLSERFVGFTQDDETGITVCLEMSTSDAAAFESIADQCVSVLLQSDIDVDVEGVG